MSASTENKKKSPQYDFDGKEFTETPYNRSHYIRAAKDLCYEKVVEDIIEQLKKANNHAEATKIMLEARKKFFAVYKR